MADKKISALTSATTPLAGTEVLPIVQSSATVKVATNDLTVRNIRANATTGILQVTGPTAASTRVVTVPDANFTAARTDAAQSFTGDQTLSTGNLVIGTAGKGIDFSVTSSGSGTMTSELLADYEEGTWTPEITGSTSNSGQTYAQQIGRYTKIGRLVNVQFNIIFTAEGTFSGSFLQLSGLPFTISNDVPGVSGGMLQFNNMAVNYITIGLQLNQNSTYAFLTGMTAAALGRTYVGITDLTNTTTLTGQFTYSV